MSAAFDARPIVVAVAGPNGAGKSTFYEAHLRASGLRFINADELARSLGIDAYRAAEAAARMRRDLLDAGESFVFETVFSDPEGDKVAALAAASERGYTVVLCFIGLHSAELSNQRVALRALSGGHDVPVDKLLARYPRSLANLERALSTLPFVRVFDNSVFGAPHRQIAAFERGRVVQLGLPTPTWFAPLLRRSSAAADVLTVERIELVGEREQIALRARDDRGVSVLRPFSVVKLAPGEQVRLDFDESETRLVRVSA